MSVVVAIKENGKVYLGADSQVTKGGTRSSLSNKNNYKIWKVKDVENCIIGHVGRVRDANIIRTMYGVVSEMAQIKNRVDYDYVVRCVVPSIFQELKADGLLPVSFFVYAGKKSVPKIMRLCYVFRKNRNSN